MEFLSDKERCDHVVNAPTPVKTSYHNMILDRLAQQKSKGMGGGGARGSIFSKRWPSW